MRIRGIPNLVVYNHPVTPAGIVTEEVRRLPPSRVGVVLRETAPLLEKVEEKAEEVEEKVESAEKKEEEKEVVAAQQSTQ